MNNVTTLTEHLTKSAMQALNQYVLPIGGAIVVLMIIIGGLQYIQGNAEAGKKTLTAAIIGLVIIALALVILNTAISIFSVQK